MSKWFKKRSKLIQRYRPTLDTNRLILVDVGKCAIAGHADHQCFGAVQLWELENGAILPLCRDARLYIGNIGEEIFTMRFTRKSA